MKQNTCLFIYVYVPYHHNNALKSRIKIIQKMRWYFFVFLKLTSPVFLFKRNTKNVFLALIEISKLPIYSLESPICKCTSKSHPSLPLGRFLSSPFISYFYFGFFLPISGPQTDRLIPRERMSNRFHCSVDVSRTDRT